ncbi:hypothetical protein EJV47_22815 [Hymenobacter gummosus]|uniref:Uncharacterized protein n=1 Tax=Hymenobacter gummosus TaxID=1776032 RepID=A0A431TWM9_9BACT|nr:hypothetical protein [Hymenobacter gummosus]RTQ45994.1 hypothetical protein EJV47_22815 [Hymenobacter gummosus]
MAIWQYHLTAIPAAEIRRRFSSVPARLFINHQGWQEYWANIPVGDALPDPAFEDAYTISWWANARLPAAALAAHLDGILPRAGWGGLSWKGDLARDEDHDCSVSAHAATGWVEEFQFRTDLRDPTKARTFLTAMLALCQRYHLLLLAEDGALLPATLSEVAPALLASKAARYLTEPAAFLPQVLRQLPGSR